MTIKKQIQENTDGTFTVISYIWDDETNEPLDIWDYEITDKPEVE